MDLFFQCFVDHVKVVISDHRSLVNDDGIVLHDVIVNHVLLVGRKWDVEKHVDGVSLQIGVEFLPVVGSKKTQGSAHSNGVFFFNEGVDQALDHLSLPSSGTA